MSKIKKIIRIPIETLEVSFTGKLVDEHEDGNFYYEIEAHLGKGEFTRCERAAAANIRKAYERANISKEILKQIKKDAEKRNKKKTNGKDQRRRRR